MSQNENCFFSLRIVIYLVWQSGWFPALLACVASEISTLRKRSSRTNSSGERRLVGVVVPGSTDLTRIVLRVYAHFSSHHIPVLDLEPILAPHVSEGLTVSRFDAHPNERAYELAAEAIRGRLLDNFTRTKE